MLHLRSSPLFRPVDVASLAFFRVAFGLIVLLDLIARFRQGLIHDRYLAPELRFSYLGFEWVEPWPGDGIYVHVLLIAIAAVCVTVGLFHRISALVLALTSAHLLLLDPTWYDDGAYLACLIALLLVAVPAHRSWSLDAIFFSSRRSDTAPSWGLWLLRAQFAMVYLAAGLGMLDEDWLSGGPLVEHLGVTTAWARALAIAWPLVGLLVIPGLLFRRTRAIAFFAGAALQLAMWWVFGGVLLPWLMLAGTALFLDPAWPRFLVRGEPQSAPTGASASSFASRLVVTAFCLIYLAIQALLPLRALLYSGDMHWTGEGRRFAWDLAPRVRTSQVTIEVAMPQRGRSRQVEVEAYLTPEQVEAIGRHPDMLLQFAHHLRRVHEAQGYAGLEVLAHVEVSFDGAPAQPLVDSAVDLGAQPRSLRPAPWILRRRVR